MSNILISGIVAHRDHRPYVQIDIDGHLAQLSVAEARSVAMDILSQAFRAESDAMIFRFFAKQDYPEGAATAIMMAFREFRSELDRERIEKGETDPDT